MNDIACLHFLQHYLPKLGYRWKGFRKVRKQVCKRINKRIKELNLGNIQAYNEYLENHVEEMKVLDALFNITIRNRSDAGVQAPLRGRKHSRSALSGKWLYCLNP